VDKRLELIDALLSLGKQAEHVAKLLTKEAVGSLVSDTVIATIETPNEATRRQINLAQYLVWPEANVERPDAHYRAQLAATKLPSLAGLTVLEYSIGPTFPVSQFHKCKTDIVTNAHKFTPQHDNVKILNGLNDAQATYDIGIIWESLEFVEDPLIVLIEMKKLCKKLMIRFRPWTSRDGGFQSFSFNKAYAQLVMDIDTPVKFKQTKPLSDYEKLFGKAGLSIMERKVNSISVEDFILTVDFLEVAKQRTWGQITTEEVVKILRTDTVDYTVLP
jgi:hypothetical protein